MTESVSTGQPWEIAGPPGRRIASVMFIVVTSIARADVHDSDDALQEVVVTATRHEESLSKVPISISAFSQDQMDAQGVKQLDDLVRLTPGLSLNHNEGSGASQISIRGISSSAGSGTTGVYIDDAPIQVRNLGFASGTAFPGLFDIDRVEVLRGPQGTLFGAGSEGGTIRFISPEPSFNNYSSYARTELSNTQGGAPSEEAGLAVGGPVVSDVLGFRLSMYYRRDGGYIDDVTGTYKILDPTGAAYGNSVLFTRDSTALSNANWDTTMGARVALKLRVSDTLTVSPTFFYQKRHDNDGPGATYWLSQSNPGSQYYSRPYYVAGNSATDPDVTGMNAPTTQVGDDAFTLSTLRFDWQLGNMQMISSTSYFDRNSNQWYDYTKVYLEFYELAQFPRGGYPPPGWKAMANYVDGQRNFVQEFRLQSNDPQSRLNWVVGAFYSHDKQTAQEPVYVNFLTNASYVGFSPDFAGYTNGPPYGPGSTALENFLGVDQGPNSEQFYAHWQTTDQQLAAFAQSDVNLTSQLKLTAGLRFSWTKLNYSAGYSYPDNNAAAPFGLACVPATYCADPPDNVAVGAYPVGTGPFTPVYPNSTSQASNTALTPKFGLSYQLNDSNMVYTTVSKGFRPAGANLTVPSICGADLTTFGYVDAHGRSTEPQTYAPDSVWSYELGSKNRLFDGRLELDTSIYRIKWKNIQTDVYLPDCAYDFVDNLASATSTGFDLGLQARPFRSLMLSGAIGYSKPVFDRDAVSPSGRVLFAQGSGIPNAGPPWTISTAAEYDFSLADQRTVYLRADFTHTSEDRRTAAMVQGDPAYDPLLSPVPAYSILNTRIGFRVVGVDAALFMDNATNAHPFLTTQGIPTGSHSVVYDLQDWNAQALRPRTYGLMLTYRR
jgi:iron complex outermembrane receptor protein